MTPPIATRRSRLAVRIAAPAIALGALVACGSNESPDGFTGPGDGGSSPCALALIASPDDPIASPTTTVHVAAHSTGFPGVLDYTWTVALGGSGIGFTVDATDGSAIVFATPSAGIYDVTVSVPTGLCATAMLPVNVAAPGGVQQPYRLRVVTGDGSAPPFEATRVVTGGSDADLGVIGIARGVATNAVVSGPGGGIAAYLRFAPDGSPDAVVEAFSDTAGNMSTRLPAQPASVLIIPSNPQLAPRRITGWQPLSQTPLAVTGGALVTGTVLDPAGGALAGATVELAIDGVPSTVATTAADGSFAVHAVPGASTTVEVTPPAASGLPRLSATAAFDVTLPLAIRYASNLALKNLGGAVVRRPGGAVLAGARVTVVGAMPAVGMVTTGTGAGAGTPLPATGEVRIAAVADASGVLPTTLVPAAVLSAVIAAAPDDLAVVALDTTASVPSELDAPAMQPIATSAMASVDVGGLVLDLVPVGALAMAAAPPVHAVADASGAFAALVASGGHYDLRFSDPLRRAASLIVADQVAASIATVYALPRSISLRGTVELDGTQPLPSASVQLLCDACSGPDRTPVAEAVADSTGHFTLAVPDPGTTM